MLTPVNFKVSKRTQRLPPAPNPWVCAPHGDGNVVCDRLTEVASGLSADHGSGGHYVHELVIPMVRAAAPAADPAP